MDLVEVDMEHMRTRGVSECTSHTNVNLIEALGKEAEQRAFISHGFQLWGYLYRFTEASYASLDPYKYVWGNDDDYDIVTYVELEAIPIRSVTPCGWTIKANNGNGWRFIARDSYRQYACSTVLEALESYIARKTKQAAIYDARAKKALWLIQKATKSSHFPLK